LLRAPRRRAPHAPRAASPYQKKTAHAAARAAARLQRRGGLLVAAAGLDCLVHDRLLAADALNQRLRGRLLLLHHHLLVLQHDLQVRHLPRARPAPRVRQGAGTV